MARTEREPGTAIPWIYEIVRIVAKIAIPLLARLRTEGLENIPREGPVILAQNHITWADIPMASMRVPRVTHYMAKIELFQVPVLGWIMRQCGAFSVRRGEGDREALRIAERVLNRGDVLVVFPEGHRSGTGHLLPGHPGVAYIALRSNAPIVPVAIAGTERMFHGFRYGPWRPAVTIRYGKPFHLDLADARRKREVLGPAADQIMRHISTLLPPEYRGAYADPQSTAPVATVGDEPPMNPA
jgi:1-acyl-sn-glycerol-3-phosphate acyltransferase